MATLGKFKKDICKLVGHEWYTDSLGLLEGTSRCLRCNMDVATLIGLPMKGYLISPESVEDEQI